MDLEELAKWHEDQAETCSKARAFGKSMTLTEMVRRHLASAAACREAHAAKTLRAAPTLAHAFVLSQYDDAAEATNAALAECLP